MGQAARGGGDRQALSIQTAQRMFKQALLGRVSRRGLGRQERLPKDLIRRLPEIAARTAQPEEAKRRKANSTRLEHRQRLIDWKQNSPQARKPWLLWATLLGIYRSETRDRPTDGRNDLFWRFRSAGNTRPRDVLGSWPRPTPGSASSRRHTRSGDKAPGPPG